jgi:hypothetical protein
MMPLRLGSSVGADRGSAGWVEFADADSAAGAGSAIATEAEVPTG